MTLASVAGCESTGSSSSVGVSYGYGYGYGGGYYPGYYGSPGYWYDDDRPIVVQPPENRPVLFVLLLIHPSVFTLTLLILLAALAFGWRITAADPMAAVVLIAFNATVIVFSLSLLSGQGTFAVWVTRLSQFLIAGLFTIGMMTLLWPRNGQPAPQASKSSGT